LSSIPELGLTPDHDLGAIHTLPDFRAILESDPMTPADRETLAEQAEAMIDGLYAHMLQKRAMYGIDPAQRLRLLRRRLAQMTDAQFHAELLRIFTELRDLHTNYILPTPYQGPFAFLGILIEQHWENGEPRWMVSKVFSALTGDPHLVAGAEVTHWNGSPIALAVARNAELDAGSNPAARMARGLENMTLRDAALSPPPDEDWVDLRYSVNGSIFETRIPWRVFDTIDDFKKAISGGGGAALAGIEAPASHLIGLDLRTELVRAVKKRLFAPQVVAAERRMAAGAAPAAPAADGVIPVTRTEIAARTVTTAHGTFGHLRIFTFSLTLHDPNNPTTEDFDEFFAEVQRVLSLMPKEGLIVDVRGNGGGFVYAAESLLQYLTPRRIQPEPTQFINTPVTAELCAKVKDLNAWSDSINASIETGAQYSSAIPLYGEDSDDAVNQTGQVYHGPVVLVTDALCYSATDTFAAGFQDHEIGAVIGVDDNTGAGGANVWEFKDILTDWPDGPFKPLPAGAQFRVALRRTLRVGKRWGGQPVEDLGVIPDVRYQMTRRDLLANNADLMEKAGELLAQGTARTLDVTVTSRDSSAAQLAVETAALTRRDLYADGRPVTTAVRVLDGTNTVTVPLSGPGPVTVRLDGFDGAALVAASTLPLD
jgi:C-terminal processing protease CtpA/Prc